MTRVTSSRFRVRGDLRCRDMTTSARPTATCLRSHRDSTTILWRSARKTAVSQNANCRFRTSSTRVPASTPPTTRTTDRADPPAAVAPVQVLRTARNLKANQTQAAQPSQSLLPQATSALSPQPVGVLAVLSSASIKGLLTFPEQDWREGYGQSQDPVAANPQIVQVPLA